MALNELAKVEIVTSQPFLDAEFYALDESTNIGFSKDFNYVLVRDGKIISEGKLPEELGPQQLRMNRIYAHWFSCYKNSENLIYYSHSTKSLKTVDLMNPSAEPKTWCTGLDIPELNLHSFIWVHYTEATDKVMVLSQNNTKVQLHVASAGQQPVEKGSVEVSNICMMLRENNRLFFGNNFANGKKLNIYVASEDGIATLEFSPLEESKVTIQDFGFIADNTMYLIYIKGEAGQCGEKQGHQLGCYILNTSLLTFKEDKAISENDEMVTDVILDDGTPKAGKDCTNLTDSWFMVNRNFQTFSCLTSSKKCVNYTFIFKDGKWSATEGENYGERSQFNNYVFALDRTALFAWDKGTSEKNFHLHIHRKSDLRSLYYWILKECNKSTETGNVVWVPTDLEEITKLLC